MLLPLNPLGVSRAGSRAVHATPAAASSTAAGSSSSTAPSATAGQSQPDGVAHSSGSTDSDAPLDVTAESGPDTQALADAVARRAMLMVVKQSEADEETQLRIDRMRADFDNTQAERAELMREANVLRDMALEQQKRDDEILKKWIALI